MFREGRPIRWLSRRHMERRYLWCMWELHKWCCLWHGEDPAYAYYHQQGLVLDERKTVVVPLAFGKDEIQIGASGRERPTKAARWRGRAGQFSYHGKVELSLIHI